jgi:hypothetical protein
VRVTAAGFESESLSWKEGAFQARTYLAVRMRRADSSRASP